MAHAELDGLGLSDGPGNTWMVPRGFAQQANPTAFPFGRPPGPTPAGEGTSGTSWLVLGCLLLLAVLLLRRKRSEHSPR
jgi:LPXTG-motif cell wall-anchored protein